MGQPIKLVTPGTTDSAAAFVGGALLGGAVGLLAGIALAVAFQDDAVKIGGVRVRKALLGAPFWVDFSQRGPRAATEEATRFTRTAQAQNPTWDVRLDLQPDNRIFRVWIDPTVQSEEQLVLRRLGLAA